MQLAAPTAAPVEPAVSSRKKQIATVLVIVVLQLPITGFLVRGNSFHADLVREGIFWVLALSLIIWVLRVERRPLSSIALRKPTWKTVVFGIVGAVVMVAGMAAIYTVIYPALGLSMNEPTLAAVTATPLWFRVLLSLRAAVFEEIFYRGFMIERLSELIGSHWVAALISLAMFTFAHLSGWGWAHLMIAAFGGLVLTVLYVLRRDLGCNMVAHFLTDAVGFLLA